MLKIEIRDASVDRATVNGKNGSFTSERQTGWITLPSGETRKVRVRVQNGKAYPVGAYNLSDDSFVVSQYGDLQVGALVLVPYEAKPAASGLK
jgi:hypothetical protein